MPISECFSLTFSPSCHLSSSPNAPYVTSGLLISQSLAVFQDEPTCPFHDIFHLPSPLKALVPLAPRLCPFLSTSVAPFPSLWLARHRALSSCCPPGTVLGIGDVNMHCVQSLPWRPSSLEDRLREELSQVEHAPSRVHVVC